MSPTTRRHIRSAKKRPLNRTEVAKRTGGQSYRTDRPSIEGGNVQEERQARVCHRGCPRRKRGSRLSARSRLVYRHCDGRTRDRRDGPKEKCCHWQSYGRWPSWRAYREGDRSTVSTEYAHVKLADGRSISVEGSEIRQVIELTVFDSDGRPLTTITLDDYARTSALKFGIDEAIRYVFGEES